MTVSKPTEERIVNAIREAKRIVILSRPDNHDAQLYLPEYALVATVASYILTSEPEFKTQPQQLND